MPSRFGWRLSLVCILAVGAVSPLLAQSQATTGVIEGTVVDPNGGVLPGATVTSEEHGHRP